jgi:alpha-galactosidase
MWAMLAAPLMVSEDLISMSSATHTTVTNREAIAIDQDPAGQQARLLSSNGEGEVWVKPLANGTHAVALLNRSSKTLELTTSAAEVGMPAAPAYQLRNVWTGAVTSTTSGIGASVPRESTVLLDVSTAPQAIEAVPKRQG